MKKFILSSVLFVVCMASQAFAYTVTNASVLAYDAMTGGQVTKSTTQIGMILEVTGTALPSNDPDSNTRFDYNVKLSAITFDGYEILVQAKPPQQKADYNDTVTGSLGVVNFSYRATGTLRKNIGTFQVTRVKGNNIGMILNNYIQIWNVKTGQQQQLSASQVISLK